MTLNAWIAEQKRAIFEDLKKGHLPPEGKFSEDIWREGNAKGVPQMGTARLSANEVILEFIYNDPSSSATILPIALTPPERVVFLPVPEWVVESIWQGEVFGSAHFESDAKLLVDSFLSELEPGANDKWFLPQPAKRRE